MAKGIARSGFDIDLRDGKRGEMKVQDLLARRIEVKSDEKQHATGRVFIELRQYGRPSGLLVTASEHWSFSFLDGTTLTISTHKLRSLCMRRIGLPWKDVARWPLVRGGDHNNYEGVLIPCEWLIQPWDLDEPPTVLEIWEEVIRPLSD